MKTYSITTRAELTEAAAEILRDLAEHADTSGRMVVGLSGDLGAGKTTLVQELASLLNVREQVTSPTFIIMKRYSASASPQPFQTLVHVDAYRIESDDELRVLGFEDILSEPYTLTCIEWPERIPALISNDAARLTMKLDNEERRTLTVSYAKEI